VTRRRRRRPAAGDVIAGVSVGLVLVPQSVAYAELAGMPPERGLLASTIPLLVAAPLASSPYLQTGPVAVTALLTFGALSSLAEPGSDEYVALGLLLALVVGVARLLVGALRAGVIAYLMSHPMLMGFIPAAATLILTSQLPAALGADTPDEGVLGSAWWALSHPGAWEPVSVLLSAVVLLAVLGGRKVHPLFPGVLVALIAAGVYSELAEYAGPTIGPIDASVAVVSLDLPWSELGVLLVPGVVIALVGFAEPASIARSFAAEDRSSWDADREFVSQGAANVAAGLSGGFPVGGSFSRSSLNRLAGARTAWSGAISGLVVLALLPTAFLLEGVPAAVLGAIVIASAVSLIRVRPVLETWTHSKPGALIAAGTFVATLASSPRVERGVLVGIGLSVAVHLWRELHIDTTVWRDGGTLHVRPQGVLWFGAVQAIEDRILGELARERDAEALVLHLDGVGRLDVTAAVALRAAMDEAERAKVRVVVEGVRPADRRLVDGVLLASVGAPRGGARRQRILRKT
jgi:SulP family sulfate permease